MPIVVERDGIDVYRIERGAREIVHDGISQLEVVGGTPFEHYIAVTVLLLDDGGGDHCPRMPAEVAQIPGLQMVADHQGMTVGQKHEVV